MRLLVVLALAASIQAAANAQTATPAGQQTPGKPSLDERLKALDTIDLSDEPEAKLAQMRALLADAKAAKRVKPSSLATVQANVGGALFYLRRYDEAVAAIDAAREILQKAGLGEGEEAAALLSNGATILADRGKYDDALARHRAALAIRIRLLGERHVDVASSTFGVGYVLFRQGKVEESLDWLRRGAGMQAELGRPEDPLAVVRMTSYASVLGTAGRVEESIAAARKAADRAETYLPKNHAITGIALNNLGKALNESGQFAEAVAVFRRALDVRVAAGGETHPSTAIALKNLASPLFAIGKVEEAEALLMRAADIYAASKETADPTAMGAILSSAATMAGARGDTALMEQRLRDAIAALETNVGADHVALVEPRTELANLLFRQGKTEEASPLAARAVEVARRGYPDDHHERTAAEIVQARLLAARGEAAAFAQAEAAAGKIERRMLDVASARSDAITLGPANARSLTRFAEFALETGHADAAFRAIQLVNLTETAATFSAVAARAATTDPEIAAMVRALQDRARQGQQLRSAHSKALAAKDEAEIRRLAQAIAASDVALRESEAALEARFPEYRAISRPAPVALAVYRGDMAPGSALLAPLTIDGRLLTVAVTRAGLVWARSDARGQDVSMAIRAVRASVDRGAGGAFDRAAAFRLYGWLMPAAVRDHVARADTLLLYGGGEFASLPLGLLVTRAPKGRDDDPEALRKTAWLIRDKAIGVPVTLAPPTVRSAQTATRFVGFGGPVLAPASGRIELAGLYRGGAVNVDSIRKLPSLPGAEQELRRMAASLEGGSRLVLGAEATETAVKQAQLDGVAVIAFATHGLVSGEMAGLGEPALVFTPPAVATAEDDGLLTASEISTLRLAADWIILSACNTAAGTGGGSPGYSGLARAFIHAGGRSLLLSHWAVRDDAAARLTVDTVRNAEQPGASRPRALQRAMLALIRDRKVPGGSHPAIWAPFAIIGE